MFPARMFATFLVQVSRPASSTATKQPILTEEVLSTLVVGRVTITAYPHDNVGSGAAFGLHNLQKLGDDELHRSCGGGRRRTMMRIRFPVRVLRRSPEGDPTV